MSDTLDLVVIGGFWGNGRKAGWFSPFLLACYNPETEELESLCKVGCWYCVGMGIASYTLPPPRS